MFQSIEAQDSSKKREGGHCACVVHAFIMFIIQFIYMQMLKFDHISISIQPVIAMWGKIKTKQV